MKTEIALIKKATGAVADEASFAVADEASLLGQFFTD
jgi:hypothetical protein